MSWAEVKKINSNMAKPLDTRINELDTGKITPIQTNVNNINTRTTNMQTTLNTVNTNINAIKKEMNVNHNAIKTLELKHSTTGLIQTTLEGPGILVGSVIYTYGTHSNTYAQVDIDGFTSSTNGGGTYTIQPSYNYYSITKEPSVIVPTNLTFKNIKITLYRSGSFDLRVYLYYRLYS